MAKLAADRKLTMATPAPNLNYDSVAYCLHTAKVRMGDALDRLEAISGRIVSRTDAYMNQMFNASWRNMQDALANLGYSRLINRVIVGSLPVVTTMDPCLQVWLSGAGYFDGTNLQTAPTLPTDFTHPLRCSERPSGQNSTDFQMEKIVDGIPAVVKQVLNRYWEWRGDAIYMPGAMQVNDLIVRYVNYLPDFTDSGMTRWYQGTVPIMRASDALGWFLCAELESARIAMTHEGDHAQVAAYEAKGVIACDRIMNRDVKADQRVNLRRQSRSGRLEGGGYYGGYDC